jgi:hypothetical protein
MSVNEVAIDAERVWQRKVLGQSESGAGAGEGESIGGGGGIAKELPVAADWLEMLRSIVLVEANVDNSCRCRRHF